MNTKIHDYIISHRDEMVETLLRLVRIPSVKGEPAEGAPYGEACREVLCECDRLFADHGFETKLHERYMLAYAGKPDAKKLVGTLAHADVVSGGEGWTVCEPFEPCERDGYLYGRGVHDDKAGIVMMLYAAKAIRELSLPFDARLTVFVGADEESGMSDVFAYIAENPMPDIGLVPDSGFPVKRGETSRCAFTARCERMLRDITAIESDGVLNRVLGNVALTLRRTDELADELKKECGERLTLTDDGESLTLSAHGITKHAASPDGSINAMLLAAKALAGCESFADREVMRQTAELIETGCGIYAADWSDTSLGQFMRPTAANGTANIVDGKLELRFDVRTMYDSACDVAKKMLNECGWTYTAGKMFGGFLLAEDDALVTAMLEEYSAFTKKEGKSFLGAGGTYSRALTRSVSVGTTLGGTPPELPKGHGGGHQPDEYIEVEAFLRAAELYTRMLVRCAKV